MLIAKRRIQEISVAALLVAQFSAPLSCQAAVTAEQARRAIMDAHVLSPGIQVACQVYADSAAITTFRNLKADDNACKIEAVVMAKTLMDLDPANIARVNVYFYSSADIAKFKSVTVTTGDVKAFGSGQVSQDELLKSIVITDGNAASSTDQLSRYLQNGLAPETSGQVNTTISGDRLEIITPIQSWVSDRDCKYHAFQLAERALAASPPDVSVVRVAFTDPASPGTSRQIVLNANAVKDLSQKIQAALSPVVVSQVGTPGGGGLIAIDGPMKEERQKLADRIESLKAKGVGIAPFEKAFKEQVEGLVVSGGDTEKISAAISRLSTSLDAQEEAAKNAKAKKEGAGKSAAASGAAVRLPKVMPQKWCLGFEPIDDGLLANNGTAYMDEIANKFKTVQHVDPDSDKRFAMFLEHAIMWLRQNKPGVSTSVFETRLNRIQQTHPF